MSLGRCIKNCSVNYSHTNWAATKITHNCQPLTWIVGKSLTSDWPLPQCAHGRHSCAVCHCSASSKYSVPYSALCWWPSYGCQWKCNAHWLTSRPPKGASDRGGLLLSQSLMTRRSFGWRMAHSEWARGANFTVLAPFQIRSIPRGPFALCWLYIIYYIYTRS